MPKKLIIFDFDGTLVDTAKVVLQILNQMRYEVGLLNLQYQDLIPWISLGGFQLISNAMELPEQVCEQHLIEFRRRYLLEKSTKADVYPGVFDAIDACLQKDYALCICTNKPRVLVEKILIETGLDHYFDFICAGDDLPTKKPHPENLKKCLEYFGVSSNSAIMVGDSSVDSQLAMNAGVNFAFFLNGYDDGVILQEKDLSFSNHAQLSEIL